VTTVDLSFPVTGDRIPRDHGYALYAALSRAVPALHGSPWLGVHPLSATLVDKVHLQLGPRSKLRLRLPAARIVAVLPLAGMTLDVAGCELRLGAPSLHQLVPAASLDARLVAIKLTKAPRLLVGDLERGTLDMSGFAERYVSEIKRQLVSLGVDRPFELRGRRSVTVGGRRIVGYSVRVMGLSADQSISLQETGIGGKRRMGCGVFRGTRGP
jgi:CRISPR-associated protein Cas6